MYTSGVARGGGWSAPGSKINPLESMIISHVMLKVKIKLQIVVVIVPRFLRQREMPLSAF